MTKYSRDDLKMFEKQYHLLLDMELKRAKQSGKSQFKVNVQAFDEVPDFKQHIWSWASKNGISYSEEYDEFIFHIS